jgi:hypothetical protein
MSAKLRLVKVAVQPYFVLDDGENITEIEHPAVVIPASEWPTYSGERFPREIAAWQAQIDTGDSGADRAPAYADDGGADDVAGTVALRERRQ